MDMCRRRSQNREAMAIDVNTLFGQAERQFASRRYSEARALLLTLKRSVRHPAVFHLLGLVEKERGDHTAALGALKQAAALAPQDPQIWNNLGNLHADVRDIPSALYAFDHAIALAPDWQDPKLNRTLALTQAGRSTEARDGVVAWLAKQPSSATAWRLLGDIDHAAGAFASAAAAYDRAIAIEPDHQAAYRGRAQVALDRGDATALARFEALARSLPADRSIAIGEAEAREAAGQADPTYRIDRMLEADPSWVEGHKLRARVRWERGDGPDFTKEIEIALKSRPRDRALWIALIEALAGVDRFADAAAAASRAQSLVGVDPELALREAIHAGEAGDDDRAETVFSALPSNFPGRPIHEARHLIRRHRYDRAEVLLAEALETNDQDIAPWALRSIVWRLTDDPRFEWLHGQSGLIARRSLGLSDMEIADAAEILRDLHRTNTFPIGQSLRGGTQTRGRLFSRAEPAIARLSQAIEEIVLTHWDGLPPFDPGHPLLRYRMATPRIVGSWSVRLTDGGFHVSHTHPQGVLSSACYLALPDLDREHGGWLELGRPPEDLRIDLDPFERIEPVVGHLVLFPSTLHHGTRPFEAGERISVAFDVIC